MGAKQTTTIDFSSHAAMKHIRQSRHISLEEFDFVWSEKDVLDFRRLWNEGYDATNMTYTEFLQLISDEFKRHPIEVAVLILDQGHYGHIQETPGGGNAE